METGFFLKGIVFGFSIAAPVGPIGILCIRRSLADGLLTGLLTGLGAATADALYGCVAGFGLTVISKFLIGQKEYITLVGGVFLCYLGIRTFFSTQKTGEIRSESGGLPVAYFSAVFLTLTNPMTILSFTAVFAGLGLANAASGYLAAGMLVTGVFTGSAIWWILLCGSLSLFREKLNTRFLKVTNRCSGIVLAGFGLAVILTSG